MCSKSFYVSFIAFEEISVPFLTPWYSGTERLMLKMWPVRGKCQSLLPQWENKMLVDSPKSISIVLDPPVREMLQNLPLLNVFYTNRLRVSNVSKVYSYHSFADTSILKYFMVLIYFSTNPLSNIFCLQIYFVDHEILWSIAILF